MGINVLRLFDGMSCGQIALERLGVEVNNYFASEIDKYTIKVTQHNYPNTIQIGDVKNIKGNSLPKIDLLIGGTPCQGFSFAGKQLNFEDPRSKLFFEFVRLLNETKPKYFLLENVKMKKEYQDVISRYLGVEPVEINSNLVSAQNRNRLYWTNIPDVSQPYNKKIYIDSILETSVHKRFYIEPNEDVQKEIERGKCSACFTERRTEEAKRIRREYRKKFGIDFSPRRAKEMVCRTDKKVNCLTATFSTKEHVILDKAGEYRKLTPEEWERLQTIPVGFTNVDGIGLSQRYKMLGNGWTVDIIAHILKDMVL